MSNVVRDNVPLLSVIDKGLSFECTLVSPPSETDGIDRIRELIVRTEIDMQHPGLNAKSCSDLHSIGCPSIAIYGGGEVECANISSLREKVEVPSFVCNIASLVCEADVVPNVECDNVSSWRETGEMMHNVVCNNVSLSGETGGMPSVECVNVFAAKKESQTGEILHVGGNAKKGNKEKRAKDRLTTALDSSTDAAAGDVVAKVSLDELGEVKAADTIAREVGVNVAEATSAGSPTHELASRLDLESREKIVDVIRIYEGLIEECEVIAKYDSHPDFQQAIGRYIPRLLVYKRELARRDNVS